MVPGTVPAVLVDFHDYIKAYEVNYNSCYECCCNGKSQIYCINKEKSHYKFLMKNEIATFRFIKRSYLTAFVFFEKGNYSVKYFIIRGAFIFSFPLFYQ